MSLIAELTLLLLSMGSAALWIRRGLSVDATAWPAARPAQGDTIGVVWLGPLPGLLDCLIFFLGWTTLTSVALGFVLDEQNPWPAKQQLAGALSAITITVAAHLLFTGPYPGWRRWFATEGESRKAMIVASLRRTLLVLPPLMLIHRELSELVPYQHGTLEQLASARDPWLWASLWIGAVVAAPLVEEYFFRGLLLRWLVHLQSQFARPTAKVILGSWRSVAVDEDANSAATTLAAFWGPVLVSAAAFAAVHLGQGLAPIPLFMLGVFLGVLARKSQSLWPCILVHVWFNAYTMFWATLQVAWLG